MRGFFKRVVRLLTEPEKDFFFKDYTYIVDMEGVRRAEFKPKGYGRYAKVNTSNRKPTYYSAEALRFYNGFGRRVPKPGTFKGEEYAARLRALQDLETGVPPKAFVRFPPPPIEGLTL